MLIGTWDLDLKRVAKQFEQSGFPEISQKIDINQPPESSFVTEKIIVTEDEMVLEQGDGSKIHLSYSVIGSTPDTLAIRIDFQDEGSDPILKLIEFENDGMWFSLFPQIHPLALCYYKKE
jgi:hypothetical protein